MCCPLPLQQVSNRHGRQENLREVRERSQGEEPGNLVSERASGPETSILASIISRDIDMYILVLYVCICQHLTYVGVYTRYQINIIASCFCLQVSILGFRHQPGGAGQRQDGGGGPSVL